MQSRAEVVILGGGVMGCSVAHHLAKLGVASTIVEQDAVASQGSGRAPALIMSPEFALMGESELIPADALAKCIGLWEESFQRFPEFAQELQEITGIDIQYGDLPTIFIPFRDRFEQQLKDAIVRLNAAGYQASWLSSALVQDRFPRLSPGLRGAMLIPGAEVEPYRYTLALARAAETKGTEIKNRTAVGFRTAGQRVTAVQLSTGDEIPADAFVIAMGPWSSAAARWLGQEVPMRINREQILVLEVPWEFVPHGVYTSRVGLNFKRSGKVLLGLGGVIDWVDFDDSPTAEFRDAVIEHATRLVPSLEEGTIVEHRACVEAWPPQALPVVGRLRGWDNAYIATGFGTIGISPSPAVGRAVADLIVHDRLDQMIEALTPSRFA